MMATGIRSRVAVMTVVALLALAVAGGATAGEPVSILGMAWTPQPGPALVVSATAPLRFRESRPEPGVVVLDFPEALPGEPLDPVAEPAAGLKAATMSVAEEGGARFGRLRLECDPAADVAVAALPAGVEVRFTGASATVAAGSNLEALDAVSDAGGVSVTLDADGPLKGKVFTLPNPPRVVVDLPGVVNRVARRVQELEGGPARRVRVAQFRVDPEPVVRVVVDLDEALPYTLSATGRGAVLRVGEATVPAAVAEAPAPAAARTVTAESAESAKPEPMEVAEAAAPVEPAATPAEEPQARPVHVEAPAVVAETAPTVTASRETPNVPPITLVDEPLPPAKPEVAPMAETTAGAAPAAETAAPAIPPVKVAEEQPAAQPASLTSAPVAGATEPASTTSHTDSPWTTSASAMVEQAAPVEDVPPREHEVSSEERHFTGEPISLELKDADIKDVLRTFAKITGLNIVVDPGVKGSVTVNLENVPWDQALDIILRINKLDYVVENNVLRVATTQELTAEKRARVELRKQEEAALPMRTVTKTLSYAKAADVQRVLQSQGFILSDRGSVVVDDRTNQLIIRDTADRLPGILNLIDSLDRPNPQVIIEARVVETTRTFSHALGVTWGFTGVGDVQHGTTTDLKFPYSYSVGGQVNLAQPGNGILTMTFGDILDAFNLDFTLSAAESNGLVKIVSSPKVTAQNNEMAHIQSGIMIPIQTVANNTVTVTYVNATLSLDVTPQITEEGTVILDIDLKKREPLAGINLQGGQNAPISTRDAKTRVMVRDGGTTVIGGIYQLNDQDQNNSVPGLSRIPILGALFRNKSINNKHDELLIFITPRIVKY